MSEGTGEGTGTGTGTGEVPAWIAQLPAEMKDNKTFHSFKTIGDFGKAYLDAVPKLQEVDGLKAKLSEAIPKLPKEATDEERNAYYNSLGRPKEPAGYEFKGENLNPKMVEFARTAMFNNGVPKEAAEAIFKGYLDFENQAVQEFIAQTEKERSDQETALKAEWGGKYTEKVENIRRFWNKFKEVLGADKQHPIDYDTFADTTKLGNNPAFIRLMDVLANQFKEDVSPSGGSTGTGAPKGMASIYAPAGQK